MSEELIGNCLVAQSGGPTAVINASVAGVVSEALNHPCIEEVYGGINGVLGILKEELIDFLKIGANRKRQQNHGKKIDKSDPFHFFQAKKMKLRQ